MAKKKKKTKKANPVGRPSRFKKEYCQELVKHMTQGYSIESFGAVANCGKTTIYRWLEEHEEFRNAYEEGRAKGMLFWEKLGVHGSVGKLPGFKDRAWIFNMKNRFGWREKLEHSGEIKRSTKGDVFAKLADDPDMMNKAMEVAEFLAEQEDQLDEDES